MREIKFRAGISPIVKIFQRLKKPTIIVATIEFHHIHREGDLWVDWSNELGAGHRKVWKVICECGRTATKISEFGEEEIFGNLRIGRTIQSQIFTTFILGLTDRNYRDTCYQIEPSFPYNILGIKKKTILQRA